MAKLKIKWLDEPSKEDYPAAQSYLTLLYDERTANTFLKKLKRAQVVSFTAKDIFRASGLTLLGSSDVQVAKDREKIKSGEKLSPLLLVRDSVHGRLIIADGYHRLCAVYSYDEDATIPSKIV